MVALAVRGVLLLSGYATEAGSSPDKDALHIREKVEIGAHINAVRKEISAVVSDESLSKDSQEIILA